jgi:hypothetical protein
MKKHGREGDIEMRRWRKRVIITTLLAASVILSCQFNTSSEGPDLFSRQNLVAWCIVPFDASERGPEERAKMLRDLGIFKIAYDWRRKDIPTFDQEVSALQENGIELHAFWCPVRTDDPLQEETVTVILDLLERRQVETELWVSLDDALLSEIDEPNRVEAAARPIGLLAAAAQDLGCSVGLYNHGGWFGEPDNQIAIIRTLEMPNIGIVYNFHHGHEHMDKFGSLFSRMKPFLMTVNLNGMRTEGPKILTLGEGDRELEMMQLIASSGYSGPIGILDHQSERDSKKVLEENLSGLETLVQKLVD